jgi:hypothetical protein
MVSFAEAGLGFGLRAALGPVGITVDRRSDVLHTQPAVIKQPALPSSQVEDADRAFREAWDVSTINWDPGHNVNQVRIVTPFRERIHEVFSAAKEKLGIRATDETVSEGDIFVIQPTPDKATLSYR